MSPFKFYIIIRISDFLLAIQNHPDIWQIWRPRFVAGFDISNLRKSLNGNYAILENLLSYFDSIERIQEFHNRINGLDFIEVFPYTITPAWQSAGYTQTIFDIILAYPNLWNILA